MNFVFVGLGGALGAVLRYAISLIPCRSDFPGALAIGFISGIADKKLGEKAVLFLKTGVCGGFTTFSTFSLETYKLLQVRRVGLAAAYSALSVGLCIAGVFLGTLAAKKFVKI